MMLRRARIGRAFRAVPVLMVMVALGACSATRRADINADAELTTGATAVQVAEPSAAPKAFQGGKDDLTLGKEHYRAGNYGLAELHFRRASEASASNAEAWLGLAAAYDQLKRFPLADRAYRQVLKLAGPTPEVLNNRGYSYLLRGDLRRASQDLTAAAAADPDNERIRNNLRALDARARRRV
jgi:Flp pilus assembly protein TadD